ncbi:hypothetical protein LXL04_031692 [Taraxacum kok-saghyz]
MQGIEHIIFMEVIMALLLWLQNVINNNKTKTQTKSKKQPSQIQMEQQHETQAAGRPKHQQGQSRTAAATHSKDSITTKQAEITAIRKVVGMWI